MEKNGLKYARIESVSIPRSFFLVIPIIECFSISISSLFFPKRGSESVASTSSSARARERSTCSLFPFFIHKTSRETSEPILASWLGSGSFAHREASVCECNSAMLICHKFFYDFSYFFLHLFIHNICRAISESGFNIHERIKFKQVCFRHIRINIEAPYILFARSSLD